MASDMARRLGNYERMIDDMGFHPAKDVINTLTRSAEEWMRRGDAAEIVALINKKLATVRVLTLCRRARALMRGGDVVVFHASISA